MVIMGKNPMRLTNSNQEPSVPSIGHDKLNSFDFARKD